MKMTRTYTRPNTNVAWWTEIMPQNVKDAIQESYIDNEFLISETFAESDDGLILTWKQHWQQIPGLLSIFVNDPILIEWRAMRDNYCIENNITSSLTYTEEFLINGVMHKGYMETQDFSPQ